MAKSYPPMDADEYHAAFRHYELSGVEFARTFGISWRQHMRYLGAPGSRVSKPVAKLIRTAMRLNLKPEEIG